eukprot:CAMPEP_0114155990 /NCGR_PEP_ID=MMETSP0043_2-20121206/25791_1 /TAXON_ID=464988 /ORGANISM="Hemiselmis andersenii, Strain CCMP644" /LENGTH=39 /DNA_ID= /DNA_START= /DNA_END= /DNA_ORIENTATION=
MSAWCSAASWNLSPAAAASSSASTLEILALSLPRNSSPS